MIEQTKVRAVLPQAAQTAFDDIVLQRVLGASKHISMIGQMFISIAEAGASAQDSNEKILRDIFAVADFFKKTRGEASQAICNAIDRMLLQIEASEKDSAAELAAKVKNAVEFYAEKSNADIEAAVSYAVEKASTMRQIMVFDYSSTVNRFLQKLGETNPEVTVIIPESRSINGGYAFVPTSLNAGMKVHFIPDAAIMHFLKNCEAAFFGAETFYADGTAFNTTGSDIVGLVCREYQVPLYVLTPMIKLDFRPVFGYRRGTVTNNLGGRLSQAGFKEDELEKVDFACPELLPVAPEFIAAFITEEGIIPTAALYGVAEKYVEKLKGFCNE